MSEPYESTEAFAKDLDAKDPLRGFRDEFHVPKAPNGEDCLYFVGNSLGLQPKKVKQYVEEELSDWAELGVKGHLHARHPWLPYHEFLTEPSARLVGAKPIEVVVMNSLTVNLHLMLVSFYRPTGDRFKILTEAGAFPSDQYAVASQARFHGYSPNDAILKCSPRAGEAVLRTEDILKTIDRHGKSIALVLFGNVNYLTGQCLDMPLITKAAQAKGCLVGFDLAHGAGNLVFHLHDWNVDFAVWCSYKYLNSGPGGLAGCFVHERHCVGSKSTSLPRFEGWWGHSKETRFQMGPDFDPIPGAEAWQLSNPPILPMAALRASLELFDEAGMERLQRRASDSPAISSGSWRDYFPHSHS